jgi:hypothetical protein
MKEIKNSGEISRIFEFEDGLRLCYRKENSFVKSERELDSYREDAKLERFEDGSQKYGTAIFTLRLTRTGWGSREKKDFYLVGGEKKLKDFIDCTLDGMTLEEYRKLPAEVQTFLERKDYDAIRCAGDEN